MAEGFQFIATDSKRPLLDQLQDFIEQCQQQRGFRPVKVLVRKGAAEWPERLDGIPLEPVQNVSYPNHFFLLRGNGKGR